MIWDEFLRHFRFCDEEDSGLGYLTKNRSEKDQKIAQSTHENGYIKPRKTFWRNSKQLLILSCRSWINLVDYAAYCNRLQAGGYFSRSWGLMTSVFTKYFPYLCTPVSCVFRLGTGRL